MTNYPINAQLFWDIFSFEFNKWYFTNENYNNDIYENNRTEWTLSILSFLEKLCEKFSCIASTEYWPRVDIGYFNKSGYDWDDWSFEVAIEHENDMWPKWQRECTKLMLLNAGLKILISYRKENRSELETHLNKFMDIFQSRKYHQETENWLFIFGPNTVIWEKIDFVAYYFDGISYKEITDNKITINHKRNSEFFL